MTLSDLTFDNHMQKAASPILVMFWQRDCPPCKALIPVLIETAKERQNVQFVLMNATDNPKTKARFGITACPTLALFDKTNMLGRWLGAIPKEKVLAWIDRTVAHG